MHGTKDPLDVHPAIASAIAPLQLVHVPSFLDGSERTSRLLSMLEVDRAGCDVTRPIAISEDDDPDRTAFYDSFQRVRRMPMDISRWIEFFTGRLATQLAEVK